MTCLELFIYLIEHSLKIDVNIFIELYLKITE